MSSNAGESSPDPLIDSPTFSSPTKRWHMPRTRSSFSLQKSSPRKRVFELDVGDTTSPQRIKVTVETDHSKKENGYEQFGGNQAPYPAISYAPVLRRNERTITTTVPVRGLSESEDDKPNLPIKTPSKGPTRKPIRTPEHSRLRARPATPGAKPAQRRRRTLGNLIDGDDQDDWDFAIGRNVESGRKKARSQPKKRAVPRKKVAPTAKNPSLPAGEATGVTSPKVQGGKKTWDPENTFIIRGNSGIKQLIEHSSIGENEQYRSLTSQPRGNNVPAPPAFPTIRSTTTIGNDIPDVLLATFDQTEGIPAKAGWSNLDMAQGFGSDSHNTHDNALYMSQMMPKSGKKGAQRDQHETRDKMGDTIAEPPEFDTILESEEFSMISMDSMPSLQRRFSSPLDARQTNEGQNKGKRKLSIIERNVSAEAATGRTKISKQEMLYSKRTSATENDNPFCNMSSEIREYVTPGINLDDTESLSLGISKREIIKMSPRFSKPELLELSTSEKEIEKSTIQENRGINDDSFSSISSDILKAATPARLPETEFISSDSRPEHGSTTHIPLLMVHTEPVAVPTDRKSLSSPRLLTPENTPSPPEILYSHGKNSFSKQYTITSLETTAGPYKESVMDSHINSSPPITAPRRYTYTAHLRQQRQQQVQQTEKMETPSIVFSPSVLPPPDREQYTREEANAPSGPSPIVRAGPDLQDATVLPASKDNTQNPCSPFQNSLSQHILARASSEVQSSEEKRNPSDKVTKRMRTRIKNDIFVGFSDDTRRELRKSFVKGQELSQSTRWRAVTSQTKPISSNQGNVRTSESDRKPSHRTDPPSQNESLCPKSHEVLANEDDHSVHDESVMSWQPEETITVEPFADDIGTAKDLGESAHQNDVDHPYFNRGVIKVEQADMAQQAGFANETKVTGVGSEDDKHCISPEDDEYDDEYEEDIWQAEARYSSLVDQSGNRKSEPKRKPISKPRRSKIPSPWRKNSKRLIYSDEIAESSPISWKGKETTAKVGSKDKSVEGPTRLSSVVHSGSGDEDVMGPSITCDLSQMTKFAPQPRANSKLDLSANSAKSPANEPSREPSTQDLSLPDKTPMTTQLNNECKDGANLATSLKNDQLLPRESHEQGKATEICIDKGQKTDSGLLAALDKPQMESKETIQFPIASASSLPSSSSKSSSLVSSTTSPTKSFTTAWVEIQKTTPPTMPTFTLPLSAKSWSRDHWLLLDSFYQESKTKPPYSEEIRLGEASIYLDRMICAKTRNKSLVLEQWHMDIVARFMNNERVEPGSDEGEISKRLFSLIIAEQMRATGELVEP